LADPVPYAGQPWAEAAIYELHVGTFTPEGTYAGVEAKLPYLKELGITAIELMPLNDVQSGRNLGL
jgi:maltooligosyltrehalose trehalohydrolase